ncbi:hypothetical protein ACOMHN_045355 [Nucella lapillus]
MFRLATPITCARPVSDFDDIGTILTHSSLTSSQKAAPWQQYVGEDGHVFYVELNQAKSPHPSCTRPVDINNTCALCSTRSCRSCASEDTGYSSDSDAFPTQSRSRRCEQAVSDLSSDSLFNSKSPDTDDKDDGVSVDLLELDKLDLMPVVYQHPEEDENRSAQISSHQCHVKSEASSRHHQSCARTASLCERHSNKLYPLEKKTGCQNERKTCHCAGISTAMSSLRTKPQEVTKEVILHLRPKEQLWDSLTDRVVWLETSLGIVAAGRVDSHSCQKQDGSDSNGIMVKGLAPDGPAARSKKLLIGDCIDSINGKQVRWSNLHLVISSLHQTKKIRLAVAQPPTAQSHLSSRLLLDTHSVLQTLQDSPHTFVTSPTRPRRGGDGLEGVCVVYMSMDGVGSEGEVGDRSDVVYQFPPGEGVLSSIRGAFFTLDHLLSDGSADSDVRILQSSELLTVSNSILRLLRLLFESLEEAFSSEKHHGSLDDFLTFTFASLRHGFREEHSRWRSPLQGYMDYLPLPEDVAVSLGNTLTEFESADFADMSDSFYDCRRSFTVLGSMAFYKGRVTCSHLSAKDAADVGVYLKHSGLLDLSTCHTLHQVLVWREIFPTRLCHEIASLNNVFGYSEPHARWFIMVVGANNTLLACVLEAGGCSTQHDGIRFPDPFYVDQARAAILHLQTPDIISACEIRLRGEGLPATTPADKLFPHNHHTESNHRTLDSLLKTTSSLVHSLHSSHLTSNGVIPSGGLVTGGTAIASRSLWKEQRKLSIDSDGSSGSGSSSEGIFKNLAKKGRLFPPSSQHALAHKPGAVLDSEVNTCNVTSAAGSLHRQVADNFCRCVTTMHADFALTANAKIYPGEGVLEDIHGDHPWRCCREEGVMFTCTVADRTDAKRSPHSLVYWVVGRKFRNLHCREVYICFQDCTPQNIVELAFKMALGSLSSSS